MSELWMMKFIWQCNFKEEGDMITDYIEAALAQAKYEIIEDEEPYYGEVPILAGVWATGKTLEECRQNLAEVIDGWIVVRLKKGLSIPPIGEHSIEELKELEVRV
jgi:Uncharacterized conserved protein